MADDDDQGTSSGSRPKLLLPKAPGPAQPLSHVASRHRKKLDAALSAGGVLASCVSGSDRKVHFQRTHSPHRISERSKASQVRSWT